MPSLLRSIATVGGNTLLSRLLGFVRDLVIARVFGADAGTDAFFVAFKIPNFMRRLFAEGGFAAAFVPVLAESRERLGPAGLKRFVDHMAGTLGGVLVPLTALGVWAAPWVVTVFAPGYLADPPRLALTADLLRLTFPYLLFISLTALCGSILNTFHRFGVPAFTPVLLNVALISAALWLSPLLSRPIEALAWGVLAAGVLQLAFQLPFLGRLGLLPRPRFAPSDPEVRQVARLMGPALLGVSVTQINLLLSTLIASFLAAGSISWLYYSDRLMEFPLGILGTAVGTVVLPSLSGRHARTDPRAFSDTLDWALRWVLLLGLPCAVGLAALAGPIMATLFHSARFTDQDVIMSTRSLWAYALGLVGFMGVKVLAPGYYARQDMRTPVRIAVAALLVNLALNLVLVFPLAHAGLALATTLAALVNAALLLRGLRREGVYRPRPGWPVLLLRGALASALMGVVILLGSADLAVWLERGDWERVARLALWIATGGTVYVAALLGMGIRLQHLRAPAAATGGAPAES